ncbi:PRTRC system protein E [Ralstonia syzygii subsp. celebesensis]|uniref:PRTRC system protein E n=1 Tax=Ralstonia syzygii TaxID=28097 RepID=UPI00387E0390
MFAELHSLAQAASLLISVTAEGDALRVTVNAAPTGKNGPAMHPLVLVGTPAELDAGFAEAIQIFEPSALPLLDQARAAANANGNKGAPALKPPPKADAKVPRQRPATRRSAALAAQPMPRRKRPKPPKRRAQLRVKAP